MANGNHLLGMDVFEMKVVLDGGPDLAQKLETCRDYTEIEPDSGNAHLANEKNIWEQHEHTFSGGQQVKIESDIGSTYLTNELNICEQNVHTFSGGQQVKIEPDIGYIYLTNELTICEQNVRTFSGGQQVKIERDIGYTYLTNNPTICEQNVHTFSGGQQVKIEPDISYAPLTNEPNICEQNVHTFSGGQQVKIEPDTGNTYLTNEQNICEEYEHGKFAREMIECGICEEKFYSIGRLNEHMTVHSQEELNINEASEQSVKQEVMSLVNTNSQNDKKPCFKPFRVTGLLKIHQKTQTGKDSCMLVCKECSVSNRTEQGSADSVQPGGHAGMENKCTLCPVVFPTISQLKHHVNRSHRKIQDGSQCLLCEVCSKEFSTKRELKKHKMRVHVTERQHKCEQCGSDFKTKSALKQHMQGHDESLYKCQVCSKSFNRYSTFHSHRWRHQRDAAVKAALEEVALADD